MLLLLLLLLAIEPLLKNWISNFGCPSHLVTDNATQFANQLINDFAEVANIDKTLINAYSHEENGMVERPSYIIPCQQTDRTYRLHNNNDIPLLRSVKKDCPRCLT